MADNLSPNLKLHLTPASDDSKKFYDFRVELAGDGEDSNMMLIDAAFADLDGKLGNHIDDAKIHPDIVFSDTRPEGINILWIANTDLEGGGRNITYIDEDGVDHAVHVATSADIAGLTESFTNNITEISKSIATNENNNSAAHQGLASILSDEIARLEELINGKLYVPSSTEENNGQFLRVVNGVATWQTVVNAEEITV